MELRKYFCFANQHTDPLPGWLQGANIYSSDDSIWMGKIMMVVRMRMTICMPILILPLLNFIRMSFKFPTRLCIFCYAFQINSSKMQPERRTGSMTSFAPHSLGCNMVNHTINWYSLSWVMFAKAELSPVKPIPLLKRHLHYHSNLWDSNYLSQCSLYKKLSQARTHSHTHAYLHTDRLPLGWYSFTL